MAFSREHLESCRGVLVPDLLAPGVRLLFVAIHPGLWCAAAGVPYAHPGNRFWPALFAGGLIDHPIRVVDGISDADRDYFTGRGLGITSLVPRASDAPASGEQLRAGRKRLRELVEQSQPRVVAVCGLDEYERAFGRKQRVFPGMQTEPLHGAELWVVPNPAAGNQAVNITALGTLFRSAALAAGVRLA